MFQWFRFRAGGDSGTNDHKFRFLKNIELYERSLSPLKASIFHFFLLITTENGHSFSIRAINLWSGLPNFQGRSPVGLQADFH